MDNIEARVINMEESIARIESLLMKMDISTTRMDEHISFVETVIDKVCGQGILSKLNPYNILSAIGYRNIENVIT